MFSVSLQSTDQTVLSDGGRGESSDPESEAVLATPTNDVVNHTH